RAAESEGSGLALFFPELMEAVHQFVLENNWRASHEAGRRALERWNAAGRGGSWEADFAETWVFWSLASMGRFDELRRLIPPRVRAAQQAGNRFMEVSLRTFFAQLGMYDDDPDGGEREAEDAIRGWLPGSDIFGNQHYWALKSRTLLALYRGDVESHAAR